MLRNIAIALFLLFTQVSVCFAGFNIKADGAGILAWSFVGFVALFVISQMIPACIMCGELIREALRGHFAWRNR